MRRFRETEVNMPSGKVDKPIIEDNRDGTVSVKYEPKEEGLHELVVKYNGEHVQETSRMPEPLPSMSIVEKISESSVGSQSSAGFVPTVKPPVGWLQTTTANHGRWRQLHQDPYQARCPLERLLAAEADICTNSVKAGINSQLCGHVDKLKNSAMSAAFKPRESADKPERPKVKREGFRNKEGGEKALSFSGMERCKIETDEATSKDTGCYRNFHGIVQPKAEVSGENTTHAEGAEFNVKSSIKSAVKSDVNILHAGDIRENPVEQSGIKLKIVDNKSLPLNPDPFTFGRNSKAVNISPGKDSGPGVIKSICVKKLSMKSPFVKDRNTCNNVSRKGSNALRIVPEKDACICKDFARKNSDCSKTWPGKATEGTHTIPKEVSREGVTIPRKYYRERETIQREDSAVGKAVPERSSEIIKIASKEIIHLVSGNDAESRQLMSVEASKGKENASQTNTGVEQDLKTSANACQTDATVPVPAQPTHSTILVVPVRKSSLRSASTDGGGGEPCSACPSTLSAGFVPGCASQSEVRRLLAAAAARPTPPHPLSTRPRSQPTVCSALPVADPRRCRSGADIAAADSSDESFSSAAPRRLGLDELSLSSRDSTGTDSGGFLSASSSYDSLRSAMAASDVCPRPLLGIPMSGARDGTPGRAESQRKRCSRALEQLGLLPRLHSGPVPAAPGTRESGSRSGSDVTRSSRSELGRHAADGGVYHSAISVSEVAPCSDGDARQADAEDEEKAWGRWRRVARNEKLRRPADSVSDMSAERAVPSQAMHSFSGGSPFKFHVDSIASGYVTAHGPGLVHGITGEPANFTISTKDAGAGGLSLAVEGPSKAEISCHDNKDGTVSVSYLPTSPGEYKVAVKFADKHIKGSPYSVKVTGEGRKRNQVSLGSQSEVTLPGKVTEKDIKALNASITAPSGLEEPCFLKKLPNDHLGISFTPREIGQHLVMVKKKGVEITGSPFKIMVSPKEVGDASKVNVSGSALKEGKTHQDNKVLIDTKEAGYGGLSMSIEGPSKAEIKCDDKDDGKLEVSYNPKEPGFYIINLKFADHHVQGSPFTAKVTGEGSNTQTERIKRDRDAAPITTVGSSCALTFKMPGVSALDLSATVASPGGVVEDASITELEDNLHAVNFVPKELGVHTVSVRYRDVHIPGSPFQFTVGPLKDGGAHRVHAGGPGLERGEQGMPNEFNVWTREAGAGSLAISVEGPSKAEIDFKDRKDGSCYVSYVVSEPGEYRVGVKFNDSHIPDSPYKVYVTPANKDAHRVTVGQLPDAGVQVDKAIVFMVDRSGCKGQLDCKVVSPSGHEDDCFAQYLDEDTYSVRFLPKENGIHQLHVKWNNVHVPGSPFRLKIGKQDADPAAVHAHGKGLERGVTGHKSDFIVDTCNAGAGTLAVTIDGPSKVAMDCTEVDEGYKVRYTPLSPGHYYVGVKYDGYHIAGSPFKVDVDGDELAEKGPKEQSAVVVETIEKIAVSKQENKGPAMPKFNSDAAQVTSKGMGLKKAFVGRQNQFSVDAGKAGQDMLWVGCFGPKNPCEEVHIKHVGRNQYQVFYTVKERGKYILVVRWGEKDIPGSPFEVEV